MHCVAAALHFERFKAAAAHAAFAAWAVCLCVSRPLPTQFSSFQRQWMKELEHLLLVWFDSSGVIIQLTSLTTPAFQVFLADALLSNFDPMPGVTLDILFIHGVVAAVARACCPPAGSRCR